MNAVLSKAALIALMLLMLFLPAVECQTSQTPHKMRAGVYPTTYTRLIAIAEAKGYFKECGVEVSIKKYPSGTSALNALCRGEVDLATVVDFRFAWKLLEDPNVRAVASTGEVFASRIVARKDRGISKPPDLKGKRIGFVSNTISEYDLHCFLLEKNISSSEVSSVPIPLLKQTDAVVEGDVDAVSAFVTFAFEAVERLGDNGVAWDSLYHTSYTALLVIKEGSAMPSTETISRFLKALIMADNYSLAHEDEAKAIVISEWGLSQDAIERFWDKTKVRVSLNQSVVTTLNIYSKWHMSKLGMKGDPPNVLKFIDTGPLDMAARERVTIFR